MRGYYICTTEFVLQSPTSPHRVRLHRGDWLVTDGTNLGRFDQNKLLDWLPVEWTKGNPVTLDDINVEVAVESACSKVDFSRLERKFALSVAMPDAPTPEMPRPNTYEGLGTYLRSRRMMLASKGSYDCR